MERATGIEPVLPAWESKLSILYFQYLQNCVRKIKVHATHDVHALPDSRIAAGRLRDGVSSKRLLSARANLMRKNRGPTLRPSLTYVVVMWIYENDSPASSSLFFQSASALFGSSAYPRTPSLPTLSVRSSETMWPTWQFSQYLPPISSAGATTAAHTEVAAPCGMVFNR